MANICPSCRSPVDSNDRFCGECGYALDAATAAPGLATGDGSLSSATRDPRSSERLGYLLIGLAGVVVIGIIALVLKGPSQAPVQSPASVSAPAPAPASTSPSAPRLQSEANSPASTAMSPSSLPSQVQRAHIGVTIRPVTRRMARSIGLYVPGGALIVQVFRDSPAAKAGLLAGDVILSFGGEHLRDAADLLAHIAAAQPGRTVRLLVRRGRRDGFIMVTPERMPN